MRSFCHSCSGCHACHATAVDACRRVTQRPRVAGQDEGREAAVASAVAEGRRITPGELMSQAVLAYEPTALARKIASTKLESA